MHLACAFILHANGARAVKQDARDQCLFNHFEIRPLTGFVKIGLGRRTARAVTHRHIHPTKAFLGIAIIIFGQAVAGLLRRIEPSLMQRVVERAIAGRQWTIAAPILVATFGAAFGAFEIG